MQTTKQTPSTPGLAVRLGNRFTRAVRWTVPFDFTSLPHVEVWYNSRSRDWVVSTKNCGFGNSASEYVGTREDAEVAVQCMQESQGKYFGIAKFPVVHTKFDGTVIGVYSKWVR